MGFSRQFNIRYQGVLQMHTEASGTRRKFAFSISYIILLALPFFLRKKNILELSERKYCILDVEDFTHWTIRQDTIMLYVINFKAILKKNKF